jgi:hypothetical protein
MQLRSNIPLKFFALILFTLEFLAPAVVTGFASTETGHEKTLLVSSSHHRNPFLSVFFEELCENEEGKEFARDTHTSEGNLFLSTPDQRLFQSKLAATLSAFLLYSQFDTHPPLFLVHRKLLI